MAFWRASERQTDRFGKGGQQIFSAANPKAGWLCIVKQNICRPALLRFAPAAALRLAVQARSLRRLSPAKAAMGGASIQRDINHGE